MAITGGRNMLDVTLFILQNIYIFVYEFVGLVSHNKCYIFWVCVYSLSIQHEKSMRRRISSSLVCSAGSHFSTLSHQGHDFRKKNLMKRNCVFWFSVRLLSEIQIYPNTLCGKMRSFLMLNEVVYIVSETWVSNIPCFSVSMLGPYKQLFFLMFFMHTSRIKFVWHGVFCWGRCLFVFVCQM
jgi:hypothetical protein